MLWNLVRKEYRIVSRGTHRLIYELFIQKSPIEITKWAIDMWRNQRPENVKWTEKLGNGKIDIQFQGTTNSHSHRYRCNQCLNIFRYWTLTKLLDTMVCMLRSWNVLVIIWQPLCVMYSMRVSIFVIFLVLLNGLILTPYTRRKIICAKKIIGLLMFWPLSLSYLKEFCPTSW